MFTPVTSDGSRPGVNCRRSKPQLSERASDFASIVFPTPGTKPPDGPATEDEYVIDDQAQRVQAGGPQRSYRTDRPGELRHHDEADGHDDAIPGGSPDRSEHAGQEPPRQQRPEGEQPL